MFDRCDKILAGNVLIFVQYAKFTKVEKNVMDHVNVRAYGKVNLGLDVTGIREDGYHLVKMVMQTVDLWDDITIFRKDIPAHGKESADILTCDVPKITPFGRESAAALPCFVPGTASHSQGSVITLSCDVPGIPADERNLAFRAAKEVIGRYGINTVIHIDIRKKIPMAAGMAGGSADAAAAILGLNELFDLKMELEDMDKIALKIGADVPFCLRRGTYLAEGIGEKLTKLPDLQSCHMVIIKPPISVSTPWAYKALDQLQMEGKKAVHPDIDALMSALEAGDLSSMAKACGNILEVPVIEKYPEIGEIKQQLMENGALTALMSGSGSVVFGIFADLESAEEAFRKIKGEGYGKFKIEF